MRDKSYEPEEHRLLYFHEKADEAFWDNQWDELGEEIFANPPRNRYVVRTTKKYLPAGSRVMEGGCGLGQMVYSLDKAGFDVHGIDYAPRVVEAVKQHWPHLKVSQGDVRNIPVADASFDGYWSFGVIEHFPEGYDDIAREMWRVLRPGGYLFLSFPAFNAYRQARARRGKYPTASSRDCELQNFYQFALNPADVRKRFEAIGFELVERRGTNSLLGMAEDSVAANALQEMLRKVHSRLETAANALMDLALGRYAGHSALLILRRK